jgi:hypothetical protein
MSLLLLLGSAPQTVSDSFTRADSTTTVGGTWVEVSGTWGILTNRAYLPSGSANAIAIQSASASTPQVVRTLVTSATTADNPILIAGWLNSSNYVYLVKAGAFATWNLVGVVGGVATTLGNTGLSAITDVTISIVKDGSSFTAYARSTAGGSTLSSSSTFTVTGMGSSAGIGTEATSSSAIFFDDFYVGPAFVRDGSGSGLGSASVSSARERLRAASGSSASGATSAGFRTRSRSAANTATGTSSAVGSVTGGSVSVSRSATGSGAGSASTTSFRSRARGASGSGTGAATASSVRQSSRLATGAGAGTATSSSFRQASRSASDSGTGTASASGSKLGTVSISASGTGAGDGFALCSVSSPTGPILEIPLWRGPRPRPRLLKESSKRRVMVQQLVPPSVKWPT